MEFHDYTTAYHAHRAGGHIPKDMSADAFCTTYNTRLVQQARETHNSETVTTLRRMRLLAETGWLARKRPFYNVWPKIIPMLLKIDLSEVTGEMLQLSHRSLLLRFPVCNNPLVCEDEAVQSILLASLPSNGCCGLIAFTDVGVRDSCGFPVVSTMFLPSGVSTVGDAVSNCTSPDDSRDNDSGMPSMSKLAEISIKICCALCLLEQKSELVEQIVCNADRLKYEKTGDEKYVERAHRKGLVGWDIGRQIVVSPHHRTPHFGLRWTGEGKKIPKIVPIKGCVVHRKIVETIPTGHQDAPTTGV